MTIQTTRWSPDTCDCIIEYQWDDSVSQDQRIHSLANYIRKCEAHAHLLNDIERYKVVSEENPRKNKAVQTVIENVPSAFVDIDTKGRRKLKPGFSLTHSATGTAPNRIFHITLSGAVLNQPQINGIQLQLNNKLGKDKAKFQNVV